MTTRIILQLADGEGLGDALAELGDWYGAQHIHSDGVWVKIGRGNQSAEGGCQFGWRITDIDVQDDD